MAAEDDKSVPMALPKEGRVIEPPLSKNLPPDYVSLPLWGEIEWKVEQIPWVAEGPYAGISGAAVVAHQGQIYIAGGFIPGGDGTETRETNRTSHFVYRFDPESGDWTQLPHLRNARNTHEERWQVIISMSWGRPD
ncbi:MAG: kelch repeat-containing protein [Planctomycetaceae bacterium]